MTPSLQIHTSNRLPVLLQHLLQRLAADPLPPFEKEVIVVQSQGMSRWLTLRLAEQQGIAMGLWTPFPSSLVERLTGLLPRQDTSTGASGASPEATARSVEESQGYSLWQLFALLDRDAASADGSDVADAYLADDDEQMKRYQLAWRLSQLFAEYQLYRPEMLQAWEEGPLPEEPTERWQAGLWKAVVGSPEAPFIEQMRRLQDRLRDRTTTTDKLRALGFPHRLSVFGISTLPPVFLQLLHRLATFLPVDLYFSSPTYHYWGDLRSPREVARLTRRLPSSGTRLAESHYETGNPLLAALGRQGRDFFNLLQEVDSDGNAWHELDFDMQHGGRVLDVLTDDILHLVDPGDHAERPLPFPVGDTSLQVHVCHSPMREMESLRDALLGLFADPQNDTLRPEDILVMVPDIDLYSPYIEAVFEVAHRDGLQLPVSIADRRATHELPTAAAVLKLLDLVKGRLTPGDVFDFLESEAVLRRFSLRAADLPDLRQWVDDLRIRWAMDGAQRRETFAVPAERANTWQSGIERLLLGYAAGPLDDLVADIAPWADEGSGDIERQGHFVALLDALFRQLRDLRRARPLADWSKALAKCLQRLFAPLGDDDERALQRIRQSLESLELAQERLDLATDVSLEAISEHLRTELASEGGVSQFLNGRITFCALKPMRSLPFEVICVAGLDDGSFPRRQPPRAFDLMQRRPRPGDRSLRDDDRYLFLETLLAARQRLILSYVGFSHKDGSPRAPSVVLSELLEQVDRTFKTEDGRPASGLLRIEHRLHPFHADYFRATAPRSYSVDDLLACRALQNPRQQIPPFVPSEDAAQVPGTAQQLEIELDELMRFWAHPCRDYCRQVIGLTLWEDRFETAGAEPFEIGGLEAYQLQQDMVKRRLTALRANDGTLTDEAMGLLRAHEQALMAARGDLPLAGLGDAAYAALRRQVDGFIDRLPLHEVVEPPRFEIAGDGWRLSGQLDGLTRNGPLLYRLARLKGSDQRRAWILHLVWQTIRPRVEEALRFVPLETRLFGRDGEVTFRPVAQAEEQLAVLIDGLRQGRHAPLPFFEGASHAFVKQQLAAADLRQGSRKTPMEAALDAWNGTARNTWGRASASGPQGGDRQDPWVALCFRSRQPLEQPEFVDWARRLWRPLLQAAEGRP